MAKKRWIEWVWDTWCIASGIGIWPRYIEPMMLEVTDLALPISHLHTGLTNLRILHFSDLHWCHNFSAYLQRKLIRKVNFLKPDLIVFTGDFLCCSQLENPKGLKNILNSLQAKIGCFAVLGNHDYSRFVTLNRQGDYDIENSPSSPICKGFKLLFQPVSPTQHITFQAQQVGLHEELMGLLEETHFQVLNNTSTCLAYNGAFLNICGLGEYILGKFDPLQAFHNYDERYPGIILSHNPDTFDVLKQYPGDIILAGHTHGGQINLPGLWKRFIRVEQMRFKRGLKRINEKWVYINRGISSVMKFRWFAVPELTLITLQKG